MSTQRGVALHSNCANLEKSRRLIEKERRGNEAEEGESPCSVLFGLTRERESVCVCEGPRQSICFSLNHWTHQKGKRGGGIKGFGEQSRARLDNYEVSEFTTPDYCL